MKIVKVNKISTRKKRGIDCWLLTTDCLKRLSVWVVFAFYRWHFAKNVFIGQQTWGVISETESSFLASIRMFHYNVVKRCFCFRALHYYIWNSILKHSPSSICIYYTQNVGLLVAGTQLTVYNASNKTNVMIVTKRKWTGSQKDGIECSSIGETRNKNLSIIRFLDDEWKCICVMCFVCFNVKRQPTAKWIYI